ncbi:MAG: Gfo/Idh/MocA family oxidoreductase [Armatimonadia bacterium]
MAERIRLGLIGCGGIAQSHLKAIAQLPEFELVAVCDVDITRAQVAAREYGVPQAFDDCHDTLKAGVDAVDICLPHHLHRMAATAAAEAGVHVLCEKPMATSLEDADAMIAAAEAAGTVLMIGQVLRFRPANLKARELIASGAIGEVKQVIRRRYSICTEYPRAPWSADPKKAGGWTLYGFGSHEADTILFLTGSEATEVYARGEMNNPHWRDFDEISILFGLSNGGFATQLHTLNCPWGVWDCIITGTGGALNIATEAVMLNEERFDLPLPEGGGMKEQIAEFGAAIREGHEPEASGKNVRRTMALLEAAKISMRTGKVVVAGEL